MTDHQKTLEAAEHVKRVVEGMNLYDYIKHLPDLLPQPSPPLTVNPFTCTCSPYSMCMNTACPRSVRVVY